MPPVVRAQLDYYSVLEITPAADTAEVNAAFRRLAWRYHPDRNPAPDATLQFQDINEAHQVLSDPSRRSEYDAKWHPKSGNRASAAHPSPRPHYRRRSHHRNHLRTVLLAVFAAMFVSSAWAVIYNTMKAAHSGGLSFAPDARVAKLTQPASGCSYSMEIVPVLSVDARGRKTVAWEAEM